MAKKKSKKTRRRILIISTFTIIITGFVIFNTIKIWFMVVDKKREQEFLKAELLQLEEEEGYLKNEVEKLKDPDYVARYAREKYLYSKDGEFTIRIP